ncbi:Flp pilus assembly protein CpaB [Sphingorhabdus lutea]|uniref:Flp pilus assembly protein CpaB n=1 Tax=Sphingorhabdus lutea TaxID=1913578 RepID=A0A1L3JCW1_9SPHN|nr:Flp pilus assembly protein CpaB [Sphingorhabdus lutea]APG62997.1 Flp pilus assembly protein CpaB [Sphingorhabdus lutea]
MDKKKVILLVGAIVFAMFAAFMAKSLWSGSSAPVAQAQKPAAPSGPMILVATRSLPVGTIITADSYRYQPWPKDLIEEAYFVKKGEAGANLAQELDGTVVRNPITAGQPITKGALVAPGDRGFLAAALGPGMRAVTVPVSALTGVAGFVFPGDRVDLVLTQKVNGVEGPTLNVSETIIRNMRVLATDQRAQPSLDDKGNTVVNSYKLVTLEATPRIAEKISVAQTIGTISLSLRSLADNSAAIESALASGNLNIPKGASREEEEKILRGLAQKPTSGKTSYSTGGDVSRFQRSTIPPMTAKQQEKIEEIRKGPVVNISRGGNRQQVEF